MDTHYERREACTPIIHLHAHISLPVSRVQPLDRGRGVAAHPTKTPLQLGPGRSIMEDVSLIDNRRITEKNGRRAKNTASAEVSRNSVVKTPRIAHAKNQV